MQSPRSLESAPNNVAPNPLVEISDTMNSTVVNVPSLVARSGCSSDLLVATKLDLQANSSDAFALLGTLKTSPGEKVFLNCRVPCSSMITSYSKSEAFATQTTIIDGYLTGTSNAIWPFSICPALILRYDRSAWLGIPRNGLAGTKSRNKKFVVLVSPVSYREMRETYKDLNCDVQPLVFGDKEWTPEEMKVMFAYAVCRFGNNRMFSF
jgi:hypothetical protein